MRRRIFAQVSLKSSMPRRANTRLRDDPWCVTWCAHGTHTLPTRVSLRSDLLERAVPLRSRGTGPCFHASLKSFLKSFLIGAVLAPLGLLLPATTLAAGLHEAELIATAESLRLEGARRSHNHSASIVQTPRGSWRAHAPGPARSSWRTTRTFRTRIRCCSSIRRKSCGCSAFRRSITKCARAFRRGLGDGRRIGGGMKSSNPNRPGPSAGREPSKRESNSLAVHTTTRSKRP